MHARISSDGIHTTASAHRGGGTTAQCRFVLALALIRAPRCRFVRAISDSAFCCVRLLVNRGKEVHTPDIAIGDIAIGMDSPVIGTAVATSPQEGHAHVES
jgi:hypothetical protein